MNGYLREVPVLEIDEEEIRPYEAVVHVLPRSILYSFSGKHGIGCSCGNIVPVKGNGDRKANTYFRCPNPWCLNVFKIDSRETGRTDN
jgi:hypothetical protein